ncbi:MAG: sulfotransferase [Nitrospirae bacterium]|nr:sulfotransferase [Nitrospirota bacterium]
MALTKAVQVKIANITDSFWLKRHIPSPTARKIQQLSRKPIVIGGCGRSGTTLLLSVLSCHPHIFGIDIETRALCPGAYDDDNAGRRLSNNKPDVSVLPKMERIYRYLWKNEAKVSATCTRWCEKTPRNVLFFETILEYFGKSARIIHIVRDGRDVITSKHPSKPGEFWVAPARWIEEVSAGLRYEKHPQVLTIRYEDLIRNYETTLRQVCEFIEEEFTDRFLSYPDCSSVTQNIAWTQPAMAVYEDSIGRWRGDAYQSRIAALLADKQAEDLLRHFGYL